MNFKWNDNTRLMLALVLSGLCLLVYQNFFVTTPEPKQTVTAETVTVAPGQNQEVLKKPDQPLAQNSQTNPANSASQPAAALSADDTKERTGKVIKVSTNLADLYFTERGGSLQKAILKKYYKKAEQQGGHFELFNLEEVNKRSLELNLGGLDLELSKRIFNSNVDGLTVKEGRDNKLVFENKNANITVRKIYSFKPASYEFNFTLEIINGRDQAVMVTPEIRLQDKVHDNHGNAYAFVGVNALKDGSLEEIDLDDLSDKPVISGDIGWATLCIPYFMGAVVPLDSTAGIKRSLAGVKWDLAIQTGSKDPEGKPVSKVQQFYAATFIDKASQIEPGKSITNEYMTFFGPRDLAILEPLGHELDRSVNFGWLDIIAKPMLSLVNFIYDFTGNYGVAIILVTLLTKIVFWPVSRKSYESMKKMQALQPQMKKIREKYKDDKQKQQQEQMALFKTHKVSPLGGCLPMIVQIPFFISFYQILGGSIELMHAPFMGWINDLSAPDRLYLGFDIPYVGGLPILTLLMGASMFIQQKMTPSTGDPTQAKMMMMMPVVFTFIFINMPSGLVLYWLVNNLLSIGQQYYTNKAKAK